MNLIPIRQRPWSRRKLTVSNKLYLAMTIWNGHCGAMTQSIAWDYVSGPSWVYLCGCILDSVAAAKKSLIRSSTFNIYHAISLWLVRLFGPAYWNPIETGTNSRPPDVPWLWMMQLRSEWLWFFLTNNSSNCYRFQCEGWFSIGWTSLPFILSRDGLRLRQCCQYFSYEFTWYKDTSLLHMDWEYTCWTISLLSYHRWKIPTKDQHYLGQATRGKNFVHLHVGCPSSNFGYPVLRVVQPRLSWLSFLYSMFPSFGQYCLSTFVYYSS